MLKETNKDVNEGVLVMNAVAKTMTFDGNNIILEGLVLDLKCENQHGKE